jgi:hypothetical protein
MCIHFLAAPVFIRVIKLRRMGWAEHVVRMGHRRVTCRVSVGRPEGKRPLGMRRIRREDNIKIDFKKWDGQALTGLRWLRIGTGGGRL